MAGHAPYYRRRGGEKAPVPDDSVGWKECVRCGVRFHSYAKRRFCGRDCANQSRVILPEKPCGNCGKLFKPNTAKSKFCGRKCVSASQTVRVPKLPIGRPVAATQTCEHCGEMFRASKSAKRKYCTVDCFHKDGGPLRAGHAAIMAKKKYGAKKDANHNEIFKALRKMGVVVKDLSHAGFGVPDGLAYIKRSWHLFDVKNRKTAYGKKGLNENQKSWADDWKGGPVFLIHDLDEAEAFARGEMENLQRFPPDKPYFFGYAPEEKTIVRSVEDVREVVAEWRQEAANG